jgi:hypothetical protein
MIFATPGQAINAIETKQTEMNELRKRFEEDYDLVRGSEYEAASGYESYTSPAPQNYFHKVTDGLNRAELQIAIKLNEGANKEEDEAASTGELFLFGALNDIDRGLRNRGEPRLRNSLGWFIDARGWVAMRALVYVPDGEQDLVFDVVPWDPLHTTWEQGDRGLIWAAHTRWVSPQALKDEWGIDTEARLTRVIDVFDREDNAVIVGSEWEHAKPPTPHEIGHTPVFVGAVGAMPTVTRAADVMTQTPSTNDSTLEDRGDSVFAAVRKIYEPRNKHVSRLMDMHKRGMTGSLVHYSPDGKKEIKGDPYRVFQAIKAIFGKEKIEPLVMPDPPDSTGPLLSILDQDIAQSTLPYPLAYGGTDDALSGRALAMLSDATRSIYNPRTEMLGWAYTWLCEEMLAQFAAQEKASTMRGFKGFEEDAPYFSQNIKPTEIDKGWFISVQVEPRLPRDQESEILMTVQATQAAPGKEPPLSMQTAREDILKLRDPHAEQQKVLAEMGMTLPPVVQARVVAALRARGEDDAADTVEQLGQEGRVPPGQPTGPQPGPAGPQRQAGAPGQAGAQRPAGPPAAQGQNGVQPPIAPEAQQLIREILRVVTDAQRNDLAQAFTDVVESRQPPPPELIQQIIQVAAERGEVEVAQILTEFLTDQPAQMGR